MINVRIEYQELINKLSAMGRQIPFVTSMAVNKTAFAARKGVLAYMPSVLHNPTPYTRRALYVTNSHYKDKDIAAKLWFMDHSAVSNSTPAERYLMPNVYGGPRSLKSTEKYLRNAGILPSTEFMAPDRGATLDQYGNLPAGQIRKMRAALSINPTRPGYQANVTPKSRRRHKKREDYYVVYASNGKPVGISMRLSSGASVPFIRFIRTPNYRPRFDFFGVAERNININLPAELSRAIDYAIRTAR